MRLGQRHGAEEAAVDHRLQKTLLLFGGAEVFDQVGRAHGQERVRGGRRVGRLEVGEAGLRQQVGQLHAADVEFAGGVEEARFKEGVHRRFHFRDQHGGAVDILRLVLVVLAVVRGEQVFRDAAGGVDGRVKGFAAVFSETLALGQAFGVQHFIQLEG